MFDKLNKRSQEILYQIVESYVESGEAVGSRTLSRRLGNVLSPATIRNVMYDLEQAGLLYSPHTSAGRIPTEAGLRYFVHGLLETSPLNEEEQLVLQERAIGKGCNFQQMLEEVTFTLSGLSKCASVVLAPKYEAILKHVEFVPIGDKKALVVLVTEEGLVENRVIEIPEGLPNSYLEKASNYVNAHIKGKTLSEAKLSVASSLENRKAELNSLVSKLIKDGLVIWSGGESKSLIVKGQANLLQDVENNEDLNRVKDLFEALDSQESFVELLDAATTAEGVQIFIGSENELFDFSGSAVVVAPYNTGKVIGALGVIGPSRMNYAKIIPMVDYTAKLIGQLIERG